MTFYTVFYLFYIFIHLSTVYLLSINLFIISFSTSIWVFFFHSFIFINNFHLLFLQMCLLSLCVFYQPIFISLTNLYFWALYGFFFSCHDKVQSENNKLHEQYKKNKE